jgi:hypothetical protein
MVVYHWLNYFYGPQGEIYNYLRFLTPSFIFIKGFLISHVHLVKYGADTAKLSRRLCTRGVKLLALFVALNALVSVLVPSSFVRSVLTGRTVAASLGAIFVVGDASGGDGGKIAAFGILVPISYLLILSSLLLVARRFFRYVLLAACVLLLMCMIFSDLRGTQYPNLELVTVGLLGVVAGYVSGRQLQQVVKHGWVVVAVYCIYLAAITYWTVSYYTQIVGAFLTSALIYVGGVRAGSKGLPSKIILLGKYSLFGYISQIAILQLLSLSLRHVSLTAAVLAGSLIAGLASTMFLVEAVDYSRRQSRVIDLAYKWIFA